MKAREGKKKRRMDVSPHTWGQNFEEKIHKNSLHLQRSLSSTTNFPTKNSCHAHEPTS
jgi:hypothetical protein